MNRSSLTDAAIWWKNFVAIVGILVCRIAAYECDRRFVSDLNGAKNGSFSAPHMENFQNYSRQCIYSFVATENERVHITFTFFALRGATPQKAKVKLGWNRQFSEESESLLIGPSNPGLRWDDTFLRYHWEMNQLNGTMDKYVECNNEYIDLYTEIEDPAAELIHTPFGGRICGRNIPVPRISMYQTLVLAFYTDQYLVTPDLFGGTFEFIDAAQYVMGTPTPNSVCSYTVYSEQKREGEMMSPTYPGVYPKNLQCHYNYIGKRGQRIRLEFMDFDLQYGGPHCPYDFVKIYDGTNTDSPLINTFCGQQRNLVIYSSSENLYVKFVALPRNAETSNRGFKAMFEFSERFVSLDFIGKTDGEHIRGTECDQKILSKRGSSGFVYSPNHPYAYHPNVVCKYYIYGMQDVQRLERVRLEFDKFVIPPSDNSECTDGFLKIYLQGQEERYALDEFDHNLCGDHAPPTLQSEGPRLVMLFNSGSTQGPGFKAKYSFETDYQVPGTAAPNGSCQFSYTSESRKFGEFNSPHYPANYPSFLVCEYLFFGLEGEQVNLVFNYFKTRMETEAYGYNEICTEDWLEIYEVYPSGRERKVGRYCGRTAPGPIVSDIGVNTMKVILHTDESGVASGFTATYAFFPAISESEDCGNNITEAVGGVLTSPRFPEAYSQHRQVCNWFISVQPHHKILLFFIFFLVEGDQERRGCPSAVVRVYPELGQPPVELCGETLTNETREIISTSNIMKISFVSADKAVGAKGFHAAWTEIKEGSVCDQFTCAASKYCIHSESRCNAVPNCGLSDDSDEFECLSSTGLDIHLIIGFSLGGAVLTVITMCAIFHRKCNRRRANTSGIENNRVKQPPEIPRISAMSDTV